jgi:small-conductance mechanosensitive channel
VLTGAFGVGIGFGLQDIVKNFVSGLILLFERPIKIGDQIQLGELAGEVTGIGIRASTVRTWEGADVIVPNGNLVSSQVINWTFADSHRRVDVMVGVAYGTDPKQVLDLLVRVASDHPDILKHPVPVALFLGFSDSSLNFSLRAWTEQADRFIHIRSELTVAVLTALREAGIEIPFPQRDLHVRSIDSEVRTLPNGRE